MATTYILMLWLRVLYRDFMIRIIQTSRGPKVHKWLRAWQLWRFRAKHSAAFRSILQHSVAFWSILVYPPRPTWKLQKNLKKIREIAWENVLNHHQWPCKSPLGLYEMTLSYFRSHFRSDFEWWWLFREKKPIFFEILGFFWKLVDRLP